MKQFNPRQEPPKTPFAMVWVGSGVIISCFVLCVLFAWGIHLDLTKEDCPSAESSTAVVEYQE